MNKKISIYLIIGTLVLMILASNLWASVIPRNVKDIVTFIFIKNDKGDLVPNGTGFFVGVKNELDNRMFNVYLVTAKHVLQDTSGNYFTSIYIRLNTRDGGSRIVEIPLKMKDRNVVFTHKEPEVDIAVIPCLPNEQLYDFKFLPDDLLTTREIFANSQIQEGDEIFFTGLFTAHFGQHRNYPIVRFGKVSLITDEKVKWEGQFMDLYLVEIQSFLGNSGSPVFFYLDSTRIPGTIRLGPSQLLLAGIMKGSFIDAKEVYVKSSKGPPLAIENAGIAAVVPAYKLYEILFSDELRVLRKNTVLEREKK